MPDKIPFIKPKFPSQEEISQDLERIYANNYYSNNGPIYHEFKQKLETYFGQDIYVVGVANATLGLLLALHAVFGKHKTVKKYIAIPSFTFSAGPLAIRWAGFEPIFFDVEADTTQPSLDSLKQVLSGPHQDQIAGVVLTSSFGIANEKIGEWESYLAERDLEFIIDSAPGIGSAYRDGSLTGGKGRSEIFSMHATKPFGIGEGGLITTTDSALAERYESLKNFSFNSERQTDDLGINAKITELDCAIGLRILNRYQETLADRRATYKRYTDSLADASVSFIPHGETAAIQFMTILVDASVHSKVLSALNDGEVDARTYYSPSVHTFPFFAESPKTSLANTEQLAKTIISLPVHPDMPAETVAYICDIIRNNT